MRSFTPPALGAASAMRPTAAMIPVNISDTTLLR